jgi:hypothetical protein
MDVRMSNVTFTMTYVTLNPDNGSEIVSEMCVIFKQLTQMIAAETCINIQPFVLHLTELVSLGG